MSNQQCCPDLFIEWVHKHLKGKQDPMCVINSFPRLVELAEKVAPTIDFSDISEENIMNAEAIHFLFNRICTMTKDRMTWVSRERGDKKKIFEALQSIGANWNMCKAPVHRCGTCKHGEEDEILMEEVKDVLILKDKKNKNIVYVCKKCFRELGRKPMTKLSLVKE